MTQQAPNGVTKSRVKIENFSFAAFLVKVESPPEFRLNFLHLSSNFFFSSLKYIISSYFHNLLFTHTTLKDGPFLNLYIFSGQLQGVISRIHLTSVYIYFG